ncbi:uncharacterized protein CC84DRAFT_1181717 [Paraphaeosphaeria sporulosa]|uniref:DUF7730 domain-containing protein n=1 Tax=Paraphaeosphaeria sporulosa TaxID=1460663 RepID=A0A177BWC8_9PLEO|nr:uncharacterized protein CC84DRAFT_1181717 [Paraphaeosphaeria sporulosa]OAF98978.1 hypothetical protein CC84DRAFT_1181717 [Paraphaeosphaeria sporulosa]
MAARNKGTLRHFTTLHTLKAKQGPLRASNQGKVLNGAKTSKPSAGDLARANSTRAWEVKKLENGLVDVANTSPWKIEVTERNATQSPLLRLPGELRNKIWRYATTGNIVNIHDDDSRWDSVFCKGHTVGVVGEDNPMRWLSTRAEDKPRLPTAFHLSAVCRQIYHEVGILAYSDSIFVLSSWNDEGELMRQWVRTGLAPAHKNAIKDIAIDEENFYAYHLSGVKLRDFFPSLERLHLNADRFHGVPDYVERVLLLPGPDLMRRLKESAQEDVEYREGTSVKLVWHENPVEDYEDPDAQSIR